MSPFRSEADEETQAEHRNVLGTRAVFLAELIELLVLAADRIDLVDVPAESDAIHRVLRIAFGRAKPARLSVDTRSQRALGTGEQVAQPAKQLELFTEWQDAKGRERLVEAIEAVKDEFSLILVISHIEDLKDAFPTRIEVTKTAAGSQISFVE